MSITSKTDFEWFIDCLNDSFKRKDRKQMIRILINGLEKLTEDWKATHNVPSNFKLKDTT